MSSFHNFMPGHVGNYVRIMLMRAGDRSQIPDPRCRDYTRLTSLLSEPAELMNNLTRSGSRSGRLSACSLLYIHIIAPDGRLVEFRAMPDSIKVMKSQGERRLHFIASL